jgi:hypothetical protein
MLMKFESVDCPAVDEEAGLLESLPEITGMIDKHRQQRIARSSLLR